MWDLFSKTKHYTAEEVHAEIIASTLMVLERIKVNVEKATLPAETNNEKAILQKLCKPPIVTYDLKVGLLRNSG